MLPSLSLYQEYHGITHQDGGEIAEWSKALLFSEKINKNQKTYQVRPPAWANLKKNSPR